MSSREERGRVGDMAYRRKGRLSETGKTGRRRERDTAGLSDGGWRGAAREMTGDMESHEDRHTREGRRDEGTAGGQECRRA